MAEAAAFAGALVLAAGGLRAAYLRLRHEHDSTSSALTVALIAGATPLLRVAMQASVVDAALFAMFALAGYASIAFLKRAWVQFVVLVGMTLITSLLGPRAEAPPTLFSTANGFLALTPVVYIATLGLVFACRSHRAECAAALTALLLWPLSGTSLVPSLAWLTPGLGVVIAWVRRKPLVAAAPLVLAVIVWNYWLMVQYTAGTIPKDAPVRFATMVRQQADVHTRPPYIYPFAFPGNFIAAWRQGVPLSRYDALAAEPLREVFEAAFDGAADRFLLEGWGRSGTSGGAPFRLLGEPRAELVFPLQPSPQDTEIRIVASLRGRDVSASDLLLEINGHAIGRVQVTSTVAGDYSLRVPAGDVGRILRAGYNRLSIVTSVPARIAIHRLRVTPAA